MGSVRLDEIKLEEYRLDELRRHQTAIAAEIGLRESSRSSDRDKHLRSWHTAIMEVWRQEFGCQQAFRQWKVGAGKRALPHLPDVEAFALHFFLEAPRAMAIHPARVLIVECVIAGMKEHKVSVTYGSFAMNLQSAGTAVDNQLPGYAKAGLLPLALRMKGSARG